MYPLGIRLSQRGEGGTWNGHVSFEQFHAVVVVVVVVLTRLWNESVAVRALFFLVTYRRDVLLVDHDDFVRLE